MVCVSETHCTALGKPGNAIIRVFGREFAHPRLRVFASVICTSLLLLVLYPVTSAAPPSNKDKSKGKIEISEHVYDFGYMRQGAAFCHNYIIKNVGQGVLNVVKIDPTCGCTLVPIKKAFLGPGEETDLHVTFKSGKYMGHIRKRIKVLSTDPENGLIEIYVKGIVGENPELVEIRGPDACFNSIDITKRELRIRNISPHQIVLSVLPMANEYFEASLSTKKIGPQDETVLTLQMKKALPLGEFQGSITFECVGEKTERVSIPITGTGYAR